MSALPIFPDRESKLLEFKERLPSFQQLIRTAVAFANGAGGKILIGIEDRTRRIIGVTDEEAERCHEELAGAIYAATAPSLLVEIYEQNFDNINIVVVAVAPHHRKPCLVKSEGMPKGVYIRVGPSTRRASAESIEDLLREQSHKSFDEELSQAVEENLAPKLLQSVYQYAPDRDFLLREQLINIAPNKIIHVTNAGILAFGMEPARFIPEAYLVCTRFAGISGREIIESSEIHGAISVIVQKSLVLLANWLERNWRLRGSRLEGESQIPIVALREAIINALVHRKYQIPGATKIALFENRLEIFSPGNLPGSITVETLGDGSTWLRNPLLAKFARKQKLVEKLGSGIKAILDSCRDAKLPPPQFVEGGDFFKVIFFMQTEDRLDAPLIERLYFLLRKKGSLTVKEMLAESEVSRNTITNAFNVLINEGKATRVGQGRGVRYIPNRAK